MMSTSQPGWNEGAIALRASRSLRRMRLRTTAVPSLRPVASPNRVVSRSVRRTRTARSGWERVVPSLWSAAKSCGRVSITSRDRQSDWAGSRPSIRPSAACGRERAERRSRAARRSSSFEPGSRAPSRDVASWAGRSASSGLRAILIHAASGPCRVLPRKPSNDTTTRRALDQRGRRVCVPGSIGTGKMGCQTSDRFTVATAADRQVGDRGP